MKFRYVNLLASLGLCASLSYSPSVEAFIAGSKATGMAAVGAAYPQDAYAGAYNPAGIVDVPDRIDVGIIWVQDRGHAKVRGNLNPALNKKYNAFKTKDVYDPDFGFNKNFCTEVCGCCINWAVGLVVYNRDYQKTTYNTPIPLLGTTNLGLEYLHETISPLLAWRINECHSFGVSMDIQVQRAKVNGLQNFDNPLFSLYPGKVTNKGYAYSAGLGATIGWKWQVNDCLSFGLTYRTKAKMSKFHKYKGFLAQRGLLNTPQKWLAGFAYKFLPCATIAFDVEWIDWHDIKSLHNPLLAAGADVDVTVPQPINKLGSKHGPGFGFRNQIFYRVGIDYQINDCLTIRAGFRHANSPVRRRQTAVNLLSCDAVQDVVTVGASYAWNCCLEVSAFYAYGFSHKIKGKDSIPLAVVPAPGVVVPLGGGNVDLIETKSALGISIGYMF